ncbi:hypothetical protein JYB64_25850, partial [Algoriphagus aestuarii]|nr:hypothetical protein [Algoriphagus aestuarii]
EVFGVDVVDADGALARDASGTPVGMSVFSLLGEIATRLEAGEDVGGFLSDIDERLEAVLAEVGSVGARLKLVLQAQDALASREITLAGRLSAVED